MRKLLRYYCNLIQVREYYQNITNNMVGRVLRNHKIVSKEKNSYQLEGFGELNRDQKEELIHICESKIDE